MFYGIGDALAGEGGLDMGIIFLQFALYLKPDFPLAYVALAEAYESAKKFDLEIAGLRQSRRGLSALAERADPEGASRSTRSTGSTTPRRCSKNLSPQNPKDVRPLRCARQHPARA